ncbi:MAG TPA: ElyC/SanA/YdcF family protein [Candidatus Pacearchaeota archaeon]|nr:ElyC/SanA/YdcF family protein [Candidatus Pacearchaeota archaeon]
MNKYILYFLTIGLLIFLGINLLVVSYSKLIYNSDDIQNAQVGLVLGAKVRADNLSPIFRDRLDSAFELYKKGKINKILVSGDHGTKTYDEVNVAKEYLLSKKVEETDIFLDHAGFDTYDSLYRAKEVFGLDDLIIISQSFHLKRALYIAYSLDLEAQGFGADLHLYAYSLKNYARESFASLKAFYEVNTKSLPKFLGPKIDIYGDGRQSWD